MDTTTTQTEFSKRTGVIIAVVGQIALLLLLVFYKLATYASGTEVFLQLRPIDPRDPLRGDYVTVNYEISQIPSYYYGNETINPGDTVYVPLYKQGKYWTTYGGPVKGLPAQTQRYGTVYIRGVVISGSAVSQGSGLMADSTPAPLVVRYGIEDYYIPEGAGRTPALNTSAAYARVAVDNDGKAIVKQLYVDDKPWP